MSNAPRNTLRNFLLAIAMLFLAGPLMAQIQTSPLAGQHETAVIIAQTSSGGSNTYLIDPLSKKVIGIIEGLGSCGYSRSSFSRRWIGNSNL